MVALLTLKIYLSSTGQLQKLAPNLSLYTTYTRTPTNEHSLTVLGKQNTLLEEILLHMHTLSYPYIITASMFTNIHLLGSQNNIYCRFTWCVFEVAWRSTVRSGQLVNEYSICKVYTEKHNVTQFRRRKIAQWKKYVSLRVVYSMFLRKFTYTT